MKFFVFLFLFCSQHIYAAELNIETHEVFKTMISEYQRPGTTPEVYPLSEKYRLDLTIKDLIDQVSLINEEFPAIEERLRSALNSQGEVIDFLGWLEELKKAAGEDPLYQEKLNKKLYLQFYTANSTALLPEYKYIDFKKIKDNGKLSRMRRYNEMATDPEGRALLAAFSEKPSAFFLTSDLTVAKLKKIKNRELKKLKRNYYGNLSELYHSLDPKNVYFYIGNTFKSDHQGSHKSKKLFKAIHNLPYKHQLLFYLASEVPGIPYSNSMYILTQSFIDENMDAIVESLKDFTFSQIIHGDDDQYLLSLRNWIKDNISSIETVMAEYNRQHGTNLSLLYKDRSKKPRRLEATFMQESLLKLYPAAPWYNKKHGVLFNRQGKEIFIDKNLITSAGRGLSKLGHNLIQTETYLSLLAGSATLVLTQGNVPVAMSTKKLVRDAVATARYDNEWEEFLKDAPQEVINTFVLQSGFSAGRFYNILALGAGQGALQSYFTGQDIKTGAMVGAGLNLLQSYALPAKWARPMSKECNAQALALNRRLETLEKSLRGTIQGATVAAIEGDPIIKGSIKGLIYGFVSTKVLIWFLGTRYYAFKNYDGDSISEMIELENTFQNEVGRGTYEINRQLILDANFRTGGVLSKMIAASITLPGNVAMGKGFDELSTLTHEAHHLMQHRQSGVFGFYLFRYLPTSLVTGYNGHPDENFLHKVIGR